MTTENLEKLQKDLLLRISRGMGDVLKELGDLLPLESSRAAELIQLESRLQESNKAKIRGTISQGELDLRYNRIRDDLIELIQSLQVADFSKPQHPSGRGRQGSLLYNIPEQMKVSKEAKCVIRLAYDEDVIISNIELQPSVVLKTVRIAEVMQAELLDPAAEPAFSIRTLSSEEQFLEEGAYTEWIFYVTPLKAGTHPLLIKVSVVEIVQGKERVREIVWEEEVEIFTETTKSVPAAAGFKSTDYQLQFGGKDTAPPPRIVQDIGLETVDRHIGNPPISTTISKTKGGEERKKETIQRPAQNRNNRKNYLNPLLGLLLIVTLGYFLLPPMEGGGHYKPPKPPPDSPVEVIQLIPADSLTMEQDSSVKEE
ncbi:MAG: hypothetical protein KTR30_08315 [Saprospiraceae bacterium]|nr:hypothetical protein [Saprospiraceae bacterium]